MHRVFFHFNKPASRSAKRPLWSVHHRGVCHIVDTIKCQIPTESKVNKRQPLVVMRGFAHSVAVKDGAALIT